MNHPPFGRERAVPLHAPVVQVDAAKNTMENKVVQVDAATSPTPDTALHTVAQTRKPAHEDYTISVEQVREHFRQHRLLKSKDTIQRWCRTGELDCKKQGILNRYFTTEASLKALEKKLLPDLIAEQVGPEREDVQVDTAATQSSRSGTQLHAAAQNGERTGMQLNAGADTAARTGTQVQQNEDAALRTGMQAGGSQNPTQSAEVAELRAQVAGLTNQLEQAQEMTKFLQEEIVSARGQRGDVVKIAEQMLGTLETMAIGGRLEKPRNGGSETPAEPVRYQPPTSDPSRV